jgi:hypothetical protein
MNTQRYIYVLLLCIANQQAWSVETSPAANDQPALELRFFSEPIFEGVIREVEVQQDVQLTLVWGTPEDLSIETLKVRFGKLSARTPIEGAAGLVTIYEGKHQAETLVGKSPLKQIQIPEGASSLLVHMIPTARGIYQFNIQDVSAGRIKPGIARVTNLSGQTIAAMVAEGKGVIGPQASLDVSLKEIERFQLKMRYATQNEDGWKFIYGTRVTAAPDDQLLIFVFRKWGNRGPWRVRLIQLENE